MYFPFMLTVDVLLFGMQLVLCFRSRQSLLRWAPLISLAAVEGTLWVSYMLRTKYSTFILGLLGLMWLAALALAWLIYGIVKIIQKRRK